MNSPLERFVTDEDLEKSLRERVTALEVGYKKLRLRAGRQDNTIAAHDRALRIIDDHRAFKYLDGITERLSTLNARLQDEILKITVVSEVLRYYPYIYPKLLTALDQPLSWWRAGKEFEIYRWINRINWLEPYDPHAMDDALNVVSPRGPEYKLEEKEDDEELE